jgi:hypothetical protein
MLIKTASWFSDMPPGHVKVGISRGVPHRVAPGYRIYRRLAPGPWFQSASDDEFAHLYRTEVLGPLNPRFVAGELLDLARGGVPVMVCYEKADGPAWCHRALAAAWLAEALGQPVPEIGFDELSQTDHPLARKIARLI